MGGDELSITYIPPSGSLYERLSSLWKQWGFICTCRKCQYQLMETVVSGKSAKEVGLPLGALPPAQDFDESPREKAKKGGAGASEGKSEKRESGNEEEQDDGDGEDEEDEDEDEDEDDSEDEDEVRERCRAGLPQ